MLYDGARWGNLHIPGNSTRDLKIGFNNRIYAGGIDQFGYFERDDSKMADSLRFVSLRHLVPDRISSVDRIHTVIVAEDSTVYFNGTFHSFIYKNDEIKPMSEDVWIFRLFNENGKVFTNDSLGISIYENGELNLIPGAEQFEYTGLYCLMALDEDTYMFAQRNRGIFIYDGEQFSRQNSEASDFLQTHAPYSCDRLPDGSFIFGTLNAGAIRFNIDGDILGWYHDKNGLPENTVYDIYADIDGTVWFSHFNHISKMDFGVPVRVMNESSGFQTMPFSKIITDSTIYLGTRSGLYSKPADDSFGVSYNEVFATNGVTRLFESDGEIYFHTTRVIRNVDVPQDVVFEFPGSIDILQPSDVNNSIIFAADVSGLYIINNDNGSFSASSRITESNLEEAHFVQNERGDTWIGSATGTLLHIPFFEVERYLETGEISVHEYEMPDGWRGDGSSRITLVSVDNEILLGTPRGLYRIDRETNQVVEDNRFGEWSRVNEAGNPNPIFRMVADDSGNVWMRGSRRYQFAERQADGSYMIHHNILKRIDDDVSNAILPVGDGKAWFMGSKGLVYYDHNLVVEKTVRPPIISRITANTDSVIYLGYSREKSEKTNLRLNYQSNDLRFEFGFPDFSTFTGTEYQVKMEGYDTDWSRWSTEAQKDYTQIREGNYTFMVRARDVTGYVREASVIPVRILPPWYRSVWAYLLYIGLISGLVYMAHIIRVRRIMEVQNIRNRIASDLHDEVSATLSSISFFAEAIDRNKEKKEGNERFLELITKSAGEAKEKITDIIWSINPENDDWVNLLSKCRRFASDMLESKGISYELDMVSDIPEKMNIELRQHFWLIFKELVTNAVRHSKASHVAISFSYASGKIVIRVADNGKGFDPDDVKEGNGLRIIQKRSEKIGAEVTFKSGSDGTEWIIEYSF
jgi:signal transduction histidine kinase/ligand-binding sensor domain-containing protein